MVRGIFVALLAAGLAGCVTATNTLSVEQVQTFRYAGVNVSFAPDANIWWGDGERAYAASKGLPATEADALAKTPAGQAYLRNAVSTRIKAATERHVAAALTGARPVRVEVVVKDFTIASGVQRVILGGHHSMLADITVVDAKTGAALLPFPRQQAMALAGQGLVGVLADSALMGDPTDRVVDNYIEQYAKWLLRPT
jgi:hypothetical protein